VGIIVYYIYNISTYMYKSTVKNDIRRLVVHRRQTTHDNLTTSVFADITDDDAKKISKSICRKTDI